MVTSLSTIKSVEVGVDFPWIWGGRGPRAAHSLLSYTGGTEMLHVYNSVSFFLTVSILYKLSVPWNMGSFLWGYIKEYSKQRKMNWRLAFLESTALAPVTILRSQVDLLRSGNKDEWIEYA